MGYWLVEKKYDPRDSSEWEAEAYVYGDTDDRETDMTARMTPGEDFIRVESPSGEQAEKQATAYWKGEHQQPEKIDAWVKSAKGD